MFGETLRRRSRSPHASGPSPRGRGNPHGQFLAARDQGSIPAWAGKPAASRTSTAPIRVHPRVGGETLSYVAGPVPRCTRVHPRVGGETHPHVAYLLDQGLAVHPRVGGETGDDATEYLSGRHRGSIPAWAGKPGPGSAPTPPGGVHPRVGGETYETVEQEDWTGGPSPRGRGNQRPKIESKANMEAVHPRVGGETVEDSGSIRLQVRWSIPAWAGKPVGGGLTWRSPYRVHPRVGGETRRECQATTPRSGPSPRGRGNPLGLADIEVTNRSIPAWAGKPLRHSDPVDSCLSKNVDCYADSPAMRRIRFHTRRASGSAR